MRAGLREDIVEILQQQMHDELLQQWREEARLKVDAWEKENKGTGSSEGMASEKDLPKTQRER